MHDLQTIQEMNREGSVSRSVPLDPRDDLQRALDDNPLPPDSLRDSANFGKASAMCLTDCYKPCPGCRRLLPLSLFGLRVSRDVLLAQPRCTKCRRQK